MPQFDAYSYSLQIFLLVISFWSSYFFFLTILVAPIIKSIKLRYKLFFKNFVEQNSNISTKMHLNN